MDTQTQTEQAPAASVEDRIASIFGGGPAQEPEQAQNEPSQPEASESADEPTPEGAEAASPEPETFELEVDGEKFTLPKKLEKGFLQEKDYTQKSQSLAEQRRALDVQLHQQRIAQYGEQFRKDTEQEHQQLQLLDWALSQPINWQSMTTDDAFKKKIEIDDLREQKTKLEKAIETKRSEWGRKQQEELSNLRSSSLEAIAKRIPGFNEATQKAIREHAISEGYSDTELNSIMDPRHVTTLWKAQQYDLLKAKAQPAVAAAKSVKTTPTNPMPQHVKDKLAFRKEVGKHAPGSLQQQKLVKDRIAKIFG